MTIKLDQIADAIYNAPGASVEMLNKVATVARTSNSASFVDIGTEFSQTFSAPVAGTYVIQLSSCLYTTTAWSVGRFRLVFDAGTSAEQNIGNDDDSWSIVLGTLSIYSYKTMFATVVLTAGSHTVKAQWKRTTGGSGSYINIDTVGNLLVRGNLVSGSGAGGIRTGSVSLSGDFSISATNPTFEDVTGMSLSVTTNSNEQVLVMLSGYATQTSTGTVWVRYCIDSTTYVPSSSGVSESNSSGYTTNISNAILTPELSAGDHVINLQVSKSATSSIAAGCYLYAIVFRGGLIPIQKDGTAIVGQPNAINFTGSNISVSSAGGKANISVPTSWITAMDLDFTAQTTQTLSPDGNYTIGSYTFAKINSAHDSTAMVLTNGVGVVIVPDSASNYYTTTRTLPALTVNLTDIIPNLTLTSRVRAWLYISAYNGAANYDAADLAIENPTSNSNYSIRKIYNTSSRFYAGSLYNGSNRTDIYSSVVANTNNVIVVDLIGGVVGYMASQCVGTWSSGWPAPSSLLPVALCGVGSTTEVNLEAAGATSLWKVLIGANRNGSGTALSVTLARLKIEYIL